MRLTRNLICSIALLSLAFPARACHEAEELGHHWEMPVYRVEMLTQILIMGCVSLVIFVVLSIRDARRKRRARQ